MPKCVSLALCSSACHKNGQKTHRSSSSHPYVVMILCLVGVQLFNRWVTISIDIVIEKHWNIIPGFVWKFGYSKIRQFIIMFPMVLYFILRHPPFTARPSWHRPKRLRQAAFKTGEGSVRSSMIIRPESGAHFLLSPSNRILIHDFLVRLTLRRVFSGIHWQNYQFSSSQQPSNPFPFPT